MTAACFNLSMRYRVQ